MKKYLPLVLISLLAPFYSAWATGTDSTYYAKLTVQRAGTGEGKIYAAKSATTPAYQAEAMTVENSATSQSVSFYIYAQAPTGTRFTGWTATDASVTDTAASNTTVTINANSESSANPTSGFVTANFEEIVYDAFSVKFSPPVNGSYTVDGASIAAETTKGPFTKAYVPELAATAAAGYAFDGWYAGTDGGGTKTLLSRASTYTAGFEADAVVFAEFVKAVQVTTYDALETSLANNVCTVIPTGTTIAIPTGKTVTVADGKQLVVDGQLNAIGKLVNNGTIGGAGVIGDITHTVTQTGNGAEPIVTETVLPAYQKKYYKTTYAADTTSHVSGKTPGCTVMKGAHVVRNGLEIASATFPAAAKPVVLACSVDSTKAVNHITGFLATSCYESVGAALAGMKGKGANQLAVLLSDQKLTQTGATSAGICVTQGSYQKLDGNFGVMDLAGKTLTVSTSYINSYSHIVLNGSLSVTTLMYSGTVTGINCSSISFSKIKEDYPSVINVYDLTALSSKIISAYNGSLEIKNSVNFYSSSTRSYSAGDFLEKAADSYHIYGGKWAAQPADKYIAPALASDYAFYKTEGASTYELQPKANREVVEIEGGSAYESLDEAVAAALLSSSAKLTLLKSATLANPITIPAGKTLEVELSGCAITAAKGFAVNHGTLILGDNRANLASTGGRIVTTSGNLIANDGTVDVTYGYYTGNIVLSGGTFTTHHGYFTGTVSAADKSWVDLRGGFFTTDVSALLKDGVFRTSGYVGPLPPAAISKEWVSSNGGYWKYTFKTLAAADLALYNNASNEKSAYSPADWKRRAELRSMVEPWLTYMVDIAAGFDRNVRSGSATATVTEPVPTEKDLPDDVTAGSLYRILSPYMTSKNATQKKYSAFLSEEAFQNTVFGFHSTADVNKGTTINLRIDLCTGANDAPQSVHALMSEYAVFGAGSSNQAMIQPASGAATFYSTIAAAVAAASDGAIIKLCNDVTATDAVTVSKPCTIDTNGMKFNGTIVAGQGYELKTTSTTPAVEKMLGKVHTTFVVSKKTAVVPSEQGTSSEPTGEGADAVIVITPAANVTALTISPREDFVGKYEIPASVTKVTGVGIDSLKIMRKGFDIAGVCAIEGGEIVLDPAKAMPKFDTESEAPLTVTADSVALAVKTIPGLTYRLLKATSLTDGFEVVKEADAKTTQLTLEVEKTADPAAFYRVEAVK